MRRSIALALALAGVLMSVASTSTLAAVVTWQLQNVVFSDDATATGTVTLDDTFPGFVKAVDIDVSAGPNHSAFHFGNDLPPDLRGGGNQIIFSNQVDRALTLTFDQSLGDQLAIPPTLLFPPNPVHIETGVNSGSNDLFIISPGVNAIRTVVSGDIVMVPEADTYVLLGFGICMLWLLMRWRHSIATAPVTRGRGLTL